MTIEEITIELEQVRKQLTIVQTECTKLLLRNRKLEEQICTCESNGIGRPRYDYLCPAHGVYAE